MLPMNKKEIIVSNIYYMLAYAYANLQHKGYKDIATEKFENALDLLAAILARGMTLQLKQGLGKQYMELDDNLACLKGKVNIKESIMLRMRHERKLSCCFDELSENHVFNQILKTTALYLIRAGEVKPKNKELLKKTVAFFSSIDVLNPATIKWHSLYYSRHNASYQMLMNICYLVLHELLLTTEKGTVKLSSFFDEQQMCRLYEKFVLEYYKKHFPECNPAAKEIKWNTTGGTAYLPKMQTDMMLTRHGKTLIIDAKYYSKVMQARYGVEKVRSSHLYQIFSYVKNADKGNTGCVDGMLLYARADDADIPAMEYNLGGNKISIRVLDLRENFAEIQKQLDDVISVWLQDY